LLAGSVSGPISDPSGGNPSKRFYLGDNNQLFLSSGLLSNVTGTLTGNPLIFCLSRSGSLDQDTTTGKMMILSLLKFSHSKWEKFD